MNRQQFIRIMQLMGLNLNYSTATEAFLQFRGAKLDSSRADMDKLCMWVVEHLQVLAKNNKELIREFKKNVTYQTVMSKTMYNSFKNAPLKHSRSQSMVLQRHLPSTSTKINRSQFKSPSKASESTAKILQKLDGRTHSQPHLAQAPKTQKHQDAPESISKEPLVNPNQFPMKVKRITNNYISSMLKSLNKRKREKESVGALISRKRLTLRKKQREEDYRHSLDELVFYTNKEFHSSSFATKLENLLTEKWHEDPNRFVIKSQMTPENHDRVEGMMENKFGRFKM